MLTVKTDDVPGTVTATIAFVTAGGKPAKVDGAPTWSADNAAVVDSITIAEDGMSATVHITDTPGAANLTVSADVDLGEGVQTQLFVDTISVIPSEAASATFTFGAVTPDAA